MITVNDIHAFVSGPERSYWDCDIPDPMTGEPMVVNLDYPIKIKEIENEYGLDTQLVLPRIKVGIPTVNTEYDFDYNHTVKENVVVAFQRWHDMRLNHAKQLGRA